MTNSTTPSTINVCNDCDAALCPKCSLCVECVGGHDDGYGGDLHYVIDKLSTLMDTHSCNPSPHHAAVTALLKAAESTLSSVVGITGHR